MSEAADQPTGPARPQQQSSIDRGTVIGAAVKTMGRWAWSLIGILLAAVAIFWLLAQLQVGVIPIMLAIIICTILYPMKAVLVRLRVPNALAAAIMLLLAVGVVGGLLASVAPGIIEQISAVVSAAGRGLQQLQSWLAGPPLNVDNEQLQELVGQATAWLQSQASSIASGFVTGVSTIGTALVTLVMVMMLTFFFLKDGERFLPWIRGAAGRKTGHHIGELLARIWNTLGAFIRTQAVVGTIDAVLIGIGLVILQVPLALALMILTFLFSFIPILGAFVAGALAVLVALVSNGWVTALWVLVIVVAVQQIEGNVIFPILQSRSVDVHPALSLVSVAIGGTTFGIVGAFLAVPVVATGLVVLRYLGEQIDVVTGDRHPEDIRVATVDGAIAAAATARLTKLFRSRSSQDEADGEQTDQASAPAPAESAHSARERLGAFARRFRRGSPPD